MLWNLNHHQSETETETEKFQPACRDRNLTRVKNETCAHCSETQRMSNSDIFVSVAGMECSYGKISIPPTEISPLHQ